MTAIESVVANLRQADATEVAHREHFEALFAAQDDCMHRLSGLVNGMVAAVFELIEAGD